MKYPRAAMIHKFLFMMLEDKRCILIAFYLFNKVEHSKILVDHVIADIFKLKNHY